MKKFTAKSFRFTGKGAEGVLGSLEQEIMDVLWARGPASGKEVLEEIRRTREIATTTVFTVLDRLAKKGLLSKTKDSGGVYAFHPVYTRDEFTKEVSGEVIKGVLDLWSNSAVASFVDVLSEKDPTELDNLTRLIEEKKKALREGGSE